MTSAGDQLICLRCGYGSAGQWLQRKAQPPGRCPQCRSQYWHRSPIRRNARTPDMPLASRQRLPRPGGGWVWVWPPAELKRLEQAERGQLRARQMKRRVLFCAARKLASRMAKESA